MAEQKRRRGARNATVKKLEARYANYFEVGQNACEFIFDFGQYHPEDDSARMHCRIVTGPAYAKLLAELLRAAIERFEEENGPIRGAEDEVDPVELVKQSIDGFEHGLRLQRTTRQ